MCTWLADLVSRGSSLARGRAAAVAAFVAVAASAALAQPASEVGGEAGLKLPDLSSVSFLGMDGHKLLMIGIVFLHCGAGIWAGDLYAAQESPRSSGHAGDF